MIVPNNVDVAAVFDDSATITDALNRGLRDALRRHKLLGHSIAVWREGKAILVPAADIQIDEGTEVPPKS